MIVQLDEDEHAEVLEKGLAAFLKHVLEKPEIQYRGITVTEEGQFFEVDITRKS